MSSELVTIHITNFDWEAHLIKGFLAEADIPVHLAGEAARHLYGLTVDGIGQIRLQVVEENVEEAGRLLAEYLARQAEPSDES